MSAPTMAKLIGDARCPECGRRLPLDVDGCAACAVDAQRDAEREERRQREAEALARLGPAPLARSLNRAAWGLVAVQEDLALALRFAPERQEPRLRRVAELVERARRELAQRAPFRPALAEWSTDSATEPEQAGTGPAAGEPGSWWRA